MVQFCIILKGKQITITYMYCHKQISLTSIYFSLFLHKNIGCAYSLEKLWQHTSTKCRLNPCHAEYFKMPRPILTVRQSDYMIQVVNTNSYTLERHYNAVLYNVETGWSVSPIFLCRFFFFFFPILKVSSQRNP